MKLRKIKSGITAAMIPLAFVLIPAMDQAKAEPALFTIDGPCSVTFSPRGGTTSAIVQFINGAKKTIRLLAYNFTSDEIGTALVDAKQRGVDVQLVLDRSVVKERNSLLPLMLSARIPTFIDRRHRIAHNKVIIIDDAWIETGSFNYTANAEQSNSENAIICPSASGADLFSENWEFHRAHSEPARDETAEPPPDPAGANQERPEGPPSP